VTSFPEITLDTHPRPAPRTHGRQLDNEAVIVQPDQGEIRVLNEVGARIWALSDGVRSARDIAATLCVEYDVTPTAAEADVLAFLTELQRKGLITIEP
jgi:hypothetical protein